MTQVNELEIGEIYRFQYEHVTKNKDNGYLKGKVTNIGPVFISINTLPSQWENKKLLTNRRLARLCILGIEHLLPFSH